MSTFEEDMAKISSKKAATEPAQVEYVLGPDGKPFLDKNGKPIPRYGNPNGLFARADRYVRGPLAQSARDLGTAALDAVNFGYSPQLDAAEAAVRQGVKNATGPRAMPGMEPPTMGQAYDRELARAKQARSERFERSPVASTAGTTAGAVGQAFLVPTAAIENAIASQIARIAPNAAAPLARAATMTAVPAALAATTAVGMDQDPVAAARNAALLGGVVGAAVPAVRSVAGGIKSAWNAARNPAQPLGQRALADEIERAAKLKSPAQLREDEIEAAARPFQKRVPEQIPDEAATAARDAAAAAKQAQYQATIKANEGPVDKMTLARMDAPNARQELAKARAGFQGQLDDLNQRIANAGDDTIGPLLEARSRLENTARTTLDDLTSRAVRAGRSAPGAEGLANVIDDAQVVSLEKGLLQQQARAYQEYQQQAIAAGKNPLPPTEFWQRQELFKRAQMTPEQRAAAPNPLEAEQSPFAGNIAKAEDTYRKNRDAYERQQGAADQGYLNMEGALNHAKEAIEPIQGPIKPVMKANPDFNPAQADAPLGNVIVEKLRSGKPLTNEELAMARDFVANVNKDRTMASSELGQKAREFLTPETTRQSVGAGVGAALGGYMGGGIGSVVGAGLGSKAVSPFLPKPAGPRPFAVPDNTSMALDEAVTPVRQWKLPTKVGFGSAMGGGTAGFQAPGERDKADLRQRFMDELNATDGTGFNAIDDIMLQTSPKARADGKEREAQNIAVDEKTGQKFMITPSGQRVNLD